MIMINNYTTLYTEMSHTMYEQNEEYMYLSFKDALPRIRPIILQMTMQEIADFIAENTLDADFKSFHQVNNSNNVIHLGWFRLGQPQLN